MLETVLSGMPLAPKLSSRAIEEAKFVSHVKQPVLATHYFRISTSSIDLNLLHSLQVI